MRSFLTGFAFVVLSAATASFGGGDACKTSAAGCPVAANACDKATLVSTDGKACDVAAKACDATKAVSADGKSCEVATKLISTDGKACDVAAKACDATKAVSADGKSCDVATKLISTDGKACDVAAKACDATKAVSADGKSCDVATKLISTDGKACDTATKTVSADGCCPGNTSLVSTDAAPSTAAKHFEALKSLAGRWESAQKGENGKSAHAVEFKVSSNGSTVVETMFPGTPMEMTNIYAVDGGRVLLTHYCAGGNQPRMQLASHEGRTMKFEFVDATNLPDRSVSHMAELELTIVGPDTIIEKWNSYADGKIADHVTMELHRVKE
jgi:hypothetical protein